MRNPKQFDGGTSMKFPKVIDKSHPAKDLKHNGTRTEQMTPWTHSGKVEKSGYEGMGNMYSKSSDRTEQMTPHSHFAPTKHSMPDVPREAKKWTKKYALDSKLGG